MSLYDLTAIAQEDEIPFQHYFSTTPMAVIEVRENKARFTRYNQSYYEFMARMMGVDISRMNVRFGETPEGPGADFARQLRQCGKAGGRCVFRERMPDGSTVHTIMRRIAQNERSRTDAIAVAVMEIMDVRTEKTG